MNKAICKAIRKRAVIQFRYDGDKVRVVEPQCHGISTTGKEVFRGYQTSGYSESRQTRAEKLFEVSKVSALKETGENFSDPGPHFNPDDKAMAYVHCCLEVNETGQQRVVKIKKTSEKKSRRAGVRSLTYNEIKKKYPNEWVLVEFSELDEDLHAREGQVIAHATSKEEIYKALLKSRGKNVSIEYFGPLSENIAVIFASNLHADASRQPSSNKSSCHWAWRHKSDKPANRHRL
jgi:hypothetical protein